jgi:host factor-I protein
MWNGGSKHMNNVQDVILNKSLQEKMEVTVILVKGFQIKGIVTSFDNFTVSLLSTGKQQMIYKHAISTIIPSKKITLD